MDDCTGSGQHCVEKLQNTLYIFPCNKRSGLKEKHHVQGTLGMASVKCLLEMFGCSAKTRQTQLPPRKAALCFAQSLSSAMPLNTVLTRSCAIIDAQVR